VAQEGQRRALDADALVLGSIGAVLVLVLALRLLPLAWVGALVGLAAVVAAALVAARRGVPARPDWLDGGTQVLVALAVALVALALVARLPIEDGEAILIVGVIASVGSLVEYRRRLEERRRAVAVALAAEILVNLRATCAGIGPEVMADLAKRPVWHKPFVVPVPPDYPVYAGNQEALGLLPAAAVRHVVSFYETDEFMTQAYNVLGTAGFHALERARQNALYAHITRRMEDDYLPTARQALEALAAVAGEKPELPDVLLATPVPRA
jgi:uncharacterized membrane protein YgdD (TMEM256/DUF423 family)